MALGGGERDRQTEHARQEQRGRRVPGMALEGRGRGAGGGQLRAWGGEPWEIEGGEGWQGVWRGWAAGEA